MKSDDEVKDEHADDQEGPLCGVKQRNGKPDLIEECPGTINRPVNNKNVEDYFTK